MFNHYLAKQDQYQELLKEAEKERLIKQIQKSENENQLNSSRKADWAQSSWLQKLSLILKDARPISPEMQK